MPSRLYSIAAALLAATSAQAAVVNETIAGKIAGAHVTDSQGYFGPAGASLSGVAFTIRVTYDSKYFAAGTPCRTHICTSYTATGSTVGQAASATMTVNGKTRATTPTQIAAVILSTSGKPFFVLDIDAYSGFGGYGNGLQLYTRTLANPVFAAPLSPGNPPLLHKQSIDYVEFFDLNTELPNEELTLNITHTKD